MESESLVTLDWGAYECIFGDTSLFSFISPKVPHFITLINVSQVTS